MIGIAKMQRLCIVVPGVLMLTAALVAADTPTPNIVFILADDQGWNALSIPMDPDEPRSGSDYFQTPNLARLTREGVRFSQAYSPAPTCSPTRHAIQWGRSPASLRIFGADGIRRDQDYRRPEESLARMIKRINPEYVTAHMGKWHVCYDGKTMGYDVWDFGEGHDSWRSHNPQTADPKDPKFIFSLTRKANAFIEKQAKAKRPFFIQISHYADHKRYDALPETVDKYKTTHADKTTEYHKDPVWAAMNEDLDTGIGMVLDKLDELGIADNTYVIYTADNGYEDKDDQRKPVEQRGYYKAHPQRSHKYTVSEGGIRVPFIVRGPGIPADTHSATPVVGTDVYATVLDILGGMDMAPDEVEGASLLAHLKSGGRKPVKRNDPFFVFKHSKPFPPHDIAIVQGDYKLIKDVSCTGKTYLYNLKTDIGEKVDLSDNEPERAKRMYDEMTSYFKRFGWNESMMKNRG